MPQLTKRHQWGDGPLAILSKESTWGDVTWRGSNTKTFSGFVFNYLELQIEFKYRIPYGGRADFQVEISTQAGDDWEIQHFDTLKFQVEPGDKDWHSEKREYVLFIPNMSLRLVELPFIVRGRWNIGGALPTNGGAQPHWNHWVGRSHTAKFRGPTLVKVEQALQYFEQNVNESVTLYKKRLKPKRKKKA